MMFCLVMFWIEVWSEFFATVTQIIAANKPDAGAVPAQTVSQLLTGGS